MGDESFKTVQCSKGLKGRIREEERESGCERLRRWVDKGPLGKENRTKTVLWALRKDITYFTLLPGAVRVVSEP